MFSKKEHSIGNVEKVTAVFAGILLIVRLAASFFPERRLWGINHLAYFSPILSWIIIIGALLVLIPRINSFLAKAFRKSYNSFKDKTKRMSIGWKDLFFVSASFSVFWLLRTKTYFLGDSYLRFREVEQGIKFKATEPLDLYLHSLAYQLTHNLWGWNGSTTYALISCLAGAVFVYSLLFLARLLSQNKTERLLIFITLFTAGATQFFFGYVESYTLMYLGIFLYITFSIQFLKGKTSFAIPSFFLLLSFGLHLSSLYLLPSLAYLFFVAVNKKWEEKEKKDLIKRNIFPYLIVGFVVLTVGYYLYRQFVLHKGGTALGSFLLPFSGAKGQAYTLFSSSHITDFLNEQILLSPLGLAIWGILGFVFIRKISFQHPIELFLGLISLASLAFAFMVDPKLGYAKDWDLFASTALGYTLLGIHFLLKLLKGFRSWGYVVLVFTVLGLVSTLPFVVVNASVDRSIARLKDLLDLDPQKSAYGREILSVYYRNRGDKEKEIEQLRKTIVVARTARCLNKLGVALCEWGSFEEGIEYLKEGIQRDPRFYIIYKNLAAIYARLGKNKEAAEQLELYLKYNPKTKDSLLVRSMIEDLRSK